jgi:membrane-bound lytic murein transglycosylase MltF
MLRSELSEAASTKNARMLFKTGPLTVAAVALLIWSCSTNPSVPERAETNAPEPQNASAVPAPPVDEAIPPVLRTPWKGDLDEIVKRRAVRVLVPFRRPEFFYMEGRPVGILQEAFRELEKALNDKFKTNAANHIVVGLLPTRVDQVREKMLGGWGDIAAYGISITEDNKKRVDFTVPTLTGVKIVPVTGPKAPELANLEDLSGKEIWISPGTRMAKDVELLNEKLKSKGKEPAIAREADPQFEPGDIMEMVNAGTYPIALMPKRVAEFWQQVFTSVKIRSDLALAEDVDLGWAIQKGTPKLKAFLDEFVKTHAAGTGFGNTLLNRYLKEAKYVKNATEEAEMQKFKATAPFFRQYAGQYKFDYLLLLAQGYQESGLDQKVKSPVGAVGIMQVMPKTAASSPVKVNNIEIEKNNIHAGVRMLHFLVNDYFDQPELDQFNRTLFAIAAYNAGPAKITKCRALAKEMGYDANKWFGNVEVATAKLVGRETTQYVSNIYKYYIAYRMAAQMKPDAVHKNAAAGKT